MMFDGCQTGDPCVLPFRYKNVTYDGCTTVEDPEDKLWCSTKVDSSGVHQRFSKTWGHCAAHCPEAAMRAVPECGELEVVDADEEFSSGRYRVREGEPLHAGRPVYWNTKKELVIFWNGAEAGWALGYEDGLQSGGSFYRSGPAVEGEPWLGRWESSSVQVQCAGEDLPFLLGPAGLAQTDKQCGGDQLCLPRERCPSVEAEFSKLLGGRKDDPARQAVVRALKANICNQSLKGFCCEAPSCPPGQRCLTIPTCPTNRQRLARLTAPTTNFSQADKLYRQLRDAVCDREQKKFCCLP